MSAVFILAAGCAGCSLPSQLDSYFGGEKAGPVTPKTSAVSWQGAEILPSADDMAYARAAAADVLRQGEKDTSAPWENPRSGARGTVTPIASAYMQDGQTCRNFLVSYVTGNVESWMQGEACKQDKGGWEVRSLKPWQHS